MSRFLLIASGAIALVSVGLVSAWAYVAFNVEQPPHVLVRRDGRIEIRDYPALRVAEVTRTGTRQDAVRSGFGPLAGYIFAREREGDRIAMTAPVTQTPEGADRWTVQFIMPADYALADLPAPAGADVRVTERPARRMAAIRFGGVATDDSIARHEADLRSWMQAEGHGAIGHPIYAYYNDPLTPGFLRRNEVLIEIGATAKADASATAGPNVSARP